MCVFTPKKAHNCAHRAHLHTSPLCVFLCVCVPNPRWVGGGSLEWKRSHVARILRPTRAP